MIGNIDILVKELCKLPKEAGWVEFKHNNCEPTMIGEDISALANSATLNDRDYAYMIWGIDDNTHEIVETKVRLQLEKKGEQELSRLIMKSVAEGKIKPLDSDMAKCYMKYIPGWA